MKLFVVADGGGNGVGAGCSGIKGFLLRFEYNLKNENSSRNKLVVFLFVLFFEVLISNFQLKCEHFSNIAFVNWYLNV